MMNTFKDACEAVADSVRNGLSPTHGEVKKRVNACHRNLMNRMDAKYKRSFMEFYPHNGCIVCPSSVERIIRHTYEDVPRTVYSKYYQFLPYGPGSKARLSAGRTGDLVDMGNEHATYFDPHAPMRVMAFSDSPSDKGATLKVQGNPETTFLPRVHEFDQAGRVVEDIPIVARNSALDSMIWDPDNASETTFCQITRVLKTLTAGNIALIGWIDGGDGQPHVFVLGKYGKSEKIANYQRYQIAGTPEITTVFALVQRAHVNMEADEDMPTIQNLAALEMESRSIEAFRTDAGRGVHFQNIAAKMLREQLKNNYVESTEITFDVDASTGPRGLR